LQRFQRGIRAFRTTGETRNLAQCRLDDVARRACNVVLGATSENAFRARKIWVSALSRCPVRVALRLAIMASMHGKYVDRRGRAGEASIPSRGDGDSPLYAAIDGRFRGGLAASRARFGGSRGVQRGKPAGQVLRRRTARQMEPIENIVVKQGLAKEPRSRLRVICATPFQKRPDSPRFELFLCCVCRSVR
jgi:hypothetical protein